MNRTTLSLSLLAALAATACYGSAPARPPVIPLPPDSADEIEVHSVTETKIENVPKTSSTCPQGHAEGDPACVVTHYTVAEPVTRTHTTARRGDQELSFAQFAVITDPKWSEKLATLDDLRHKCTRANVPRYAGIGLMVGGLVVGSIVGGDAGKGIAYGGIAGGGASYGVGFFAYGGKDCVRAQALHDSMDFSGQTTWMEVEGGEYAARMKELADRYNLSRGSHAQARR